MTAPHAQWATENVVADPAGELDPDLARADYVMWCSDHRQRPEPRSKMRAALIRAGAKAKGRGADLRFVGVTLRPVIDSGYRAGGRWTNIVGPDGLLAALSALRAAGVVTNRVALNRAWRELQ